MFTELPDFRLDVSSTELRAEQKRHAEAQALSKSLKLNLDNRNLNDAVFGAETQANARAGGMPARKPTGPARMQAAARVGLGGSARGSRF